MRRWDIELKKPKRECRKQRLLRTQAVLRGLATTLAAGAKPASRSHVLCKAHFPRPNCRA